MFLNLLEDENKLLFLKISMKAAMINDEFTPEEEELLYAYCREMNIPETIPYGDEDYEEILDELSVQADDVEKKIVILETLGLVRTDGHYDEKERSFMEYLAKRLDVNVSVLDYFNSLLEIYTTVCQELTNAIYS